VNTNTSNEQHPQPIAGGAARVIEVVQTTLVRRGDGIVGPFRSIIQYWSKNGALLAEYDPFADQESAELRGQLRTLKEEHASLGRHATLIRESSEQLRAQLTAAGSRIAQLEQVREQNESRAAGTQKRSIKRLRALKRLKRGSRK
jgi:hypothetical protein